MWLVSSSPRWIGGDLSLRLVRVSIFAVMLPSLIEPDGLSPIHACMAYLTSLQPVLKTPCVQTVLVRLMCYQLTMTEIFVACGHILVRKPYVIQPQDEFHLTRTTASSTVTVPIACEARTIPVKPTVARPFAYKCTPIFSKPTIRFSYPSVLHPHNLSQNNTTVIARDAATESLRLS
jgi:hypothetical protein